jgi:hypothetical protein
MRELYKSVLEERSSNWNSLKEEAASRYTNKVNSVTAYLQYLYSS